MCAVHRLQVHLRVPVAIVDNDRVCGHKVDAQPTGACGEQKDELLAAISIVCVDHVLAVVARGVAVDAAVLVLAVDKVVLQNIQQPGHLGEDEHAAPLLLEAGQKLIQQHQLARVLDEVLAGKVGRAGLGALEQVRVVAALAQLHDHVEKARAVTARVDHLDVLLQRALVKLLLHVAHADLEDHLLLGRETLLYLRLKAPQEERAEHFV
mmetsp:Transcript_8046/g.19965  ORF Transcript_8046/g.19965 Transcript_8046/m.19965 type:complete len:209 (-) Transcript_8046:1229-1855(-)